MRVLNLANEDHANYSHDNAKSLRAVGIVCTDLKLMPHPFRYSTQSKVVQLSTMIMQVALLNAHDYVQIFFSDVRILQTIRPALGKTKLIVVHAGTSYRMRPDEMNKVFNPVAWKSVIALGEFENLGAVNSVYVIGGIDTDKFKPQYIRDDQKTIFIGHFPSNAEVKGTKNILKVIEGLRDSFGDKFVFDCNPNPVSHDHHIERLGLYDIYIEALEMRNHGQPYGSWGISAMEAAAMGKLVITHHLYDELYAREYGDFGCSVANTINDLFVELSYLVNNKDEIILRQKACRKWVEEKHSYKAIGQRYKEKVLEI